MAFCKGRLPSSAPAAGLQSPQAQTAGLRRRRGGAWPEVEQQGRRPHPRHQRPPGHAGGLPPCHDRPTTDRPPADSHRASGRCHRPPAAAAFRSASVNGGNPAPSTGRRHAAGGRIGVAVHPNHFGLAEWSGRWRVGVAGGRASQSALRRLSWMAPAAESRCRLQPAPRGKPPQSCCTAATRQSWQGSSRGSGSEQGGGDRGRTHR